MTYRELESNYGEVIASRMYTILTLESKESLVQSLLDFMGQKVLDDWAKAIERAIPNELAAG
jgi:hypothetical protein